MQHIAYYRPLRLLGPRVPTEYPVIVKRLDRAVLALQIDPGPKKARELLVVARHRVGKRKANRQRLRYRNRKGRVE